MNAIPYVLGHFVPRLSTDSLLQYRLVCPYPNCLICQLLPPYLLFVCPASDDDHTSNPQVFLAPLSPGQEDNTPPPQATHIATIPNRRYSEVDAQCVSGRLCMYPKNSSPSEAFVDILNLTTGKIITLPDDPSIRNGFPASTHFGYDPVQDKFKVLRLLKDDDSHKFKISIFTINDPTTNSWRSVPVPVPAEDRRITPDEWFMEDKRGVCVNGAIHWKYLAYILAFDLRSEQFRWIKIPESYEKENLKLPHLRLPDLVELNGYLTLVRYDFNDLNLTALKDYGTPTQKWTGDILLGSVIGGKEPTPGKEEEEKEPTPGEEEEEEEEEPEPFHFPLYWVANTGEILLFPHSSRARVRAIFYDIRRQSRRDVVVMNAPRPLRPDPNSGSVNIFCCYKYPGPLQGQ